MMRSAVSSIRRRAPASLVGFSGRAGAPDLPSTRMPSKSYVPGSAMSFKDQKTKRTGVWTPFLQCSCPESDQLCVLEDPRRSGPRQPPL
eukprot:1119017-Pyramimonas_sp.AAC.1